MKVRAAVAAGAAFVLLLALGYATIGGARGWLEPVEAAVAAVAGVNHPLMFAEGSASARLFHLTALVAGLALRVLLFAGTTAWLLRKRLEPRRDARPARKVPRARVVAQVAPDWLEVSRN